VYRGFTCQIFIEGHFGLTFSQPGDSGSLVCGLDDGTYHPVGLLFAGGQAADGTMVTYANPIDEVMAALHITQILDQEV
jgi:hypothetical protein